MNEVSARDFGRMEAKVDLLIASNAAQEKELTELRSRVDKWEQRAIGAFTVAGAIGAALMWLATYVKGWLTA